MIVKIMKIKVRTKRIASIHWARPNLLFWRMLPTQKRIKTRAMQAVFKAGHQRYSFCKNKQ